MAENTAFCRTGTLSVANSGTALFDWLILALTDMGDHYWSVPASNATQALLECTATGAQVVVHASAGNLQFGLASEGGVTNYTTTPPTLTAGKPFTGMKTISGSASNMSLAGTDVRLAEYPDALALLNGGATYTRYIAHMGKIFEPQDKSDAGIGLDGHGVMMGRGLQNISPGYWTGSSFATPIYSPCIRTGSTSSSNSTGFSVVRIVTVWAAGNVVLTDVDGLVRLVPHQMVIVNSSNVNTSYIGVTKYVRLYKSNFNHWQVLESTTAGSDQAWLGWIGDAGSTANNNQCLLWSKSPAVV